MDLLDLSKKTKQEQAAYWKQRDEWEKAGLCEACGSQLKGIKRLCVNKSCDRSKHSRSCSCMYGMDEDHCTCEKMAMERKYEKSGWIDNEGLHIGYHGHLTYTLAKEFYAKARNPEAGRPICNNTRLMKRGESFAVRLHETDIITINPDNTFILKTGGWFTQTTKERLDCYAPVRIFSDHGVWKVCARNQRPWGDGVRTELFQEGMMVTSRGKVTRNSGSTARNLKKISEQINHYVDGYCKHLVKEAQKHGAIPRPGRGDCMACAFSTPEATKYGKFEDPMGHDHYLMHFSQRYFVPSLLWNSVVERARNPEFLWSMIESGAKRGDVDLARMTLRKFLRKRIPMLLALMDDNFRTATPQVDVQLVSLHGQTLHYKQM